MCITFLYYRVLLRSCENRLFIMPQKKVNYCTQNKEKIIKSIQLNKPRNGQLSIKKLQFDFKSLLLLTMPGLAFCLGCWQYRRLKWKLDLIDSMSKSVEKPAIEFPFHNLSLLDDLEYRRVHLKGQFLYDRQFYIPRRARFDKASDDIHPSGLIGNAESTSRGSHIIAPFKLYGTELVIMVNRGWLPPEKVEEEISNKNRPSPVVEIDAIVRKPEVKPWFFEANIPEKNKWLYKDFKEMGQWCGASPIFMDAVYESSIPNGPIGGQTNITLRNEHLNYMITWFSLSAFTFGTWMVTYGSRLWRR